VGAAHNLSAKFLGCTEKPACVEAAQALARLDCVGPPQMDFAR
jgi:hypothetical protein